MSGLSLEEYFLSHQLSILDSPYQTEEKLFFVGGNERAVFNFFEQLGRRYNFDGYIFGCGSTTIWGLSILFKNSALPKGMILADVDFRVVLYTKLLIQLMKQCPEFLGLVEAIAEVNKRGWRDELWAINEKEADPLLKKIGEAWLNQSCQRFFPGGKYQWQKYFMLDYANRKDWHTSDAMINVIYLLKQTYPILHRLASDGNIVMIYRDVFDSDLLKLIEGLPGYQQSTSILYLSNAVDHLLMQADIRRSYGAICRFSDYLNRVRLNGLKRLIPTQPHHLICIDTLRTHDYFLRAQEGIPVFSVDNFLGGPV